MAVFTHCDFGHLLVRHQVKPQELADTLGCEDYLGHVHEDEALGCAWLEKMGWPRVDGLLR